MGVDPGAWRPRDRQLSAPYLPARKRIWAVGPAESGKSMWAAFKASELTRAGFVVVYVSQENGLEEEVRRFVRMGPDFSKLRLCVDQGLDLTIAAHVDALVELSRGAALTALDTLSACWSGNEDSNADVAAFDRDCLLRLIRETGSAPLVLDHTGNPQAFVRRHGVSAPRGASTKGQKADWLLEFRAAGEAEFSISHAKARGGTKEPPRTFRVVDAEDGALELVESEHVGEAVEHVRDRVLAFLEAQEDWASKSQVREGVKGEDKLVDSCLWQMLDEGLVAVSVGVAGTPTRSVGDEQRADLRRRRRPTYWILSSRAGLQSAFEMTPTDADCEPRAPETAVRR